MKMSALAVVLGLVVGAQSAQAELRFNAKIFEEGSDKKNLLFTYKSELEKKGDTSVITNTYSEPGGAVVAIETTEYGKDGAIKSYKMSQKQLGAEGAVTVADGKAKFTYSRDGKDKSDEEGVGGDFIAGPRIPDDIKANWDKLMKGEKISRRLAVLDRQETVGFEFAKFKDSEINGQKAVIIRMKPSSFVISQLVDPLMFYFSADGQKLLELRGRTQVKRKDGSKYKDLDGETVFDYASSGGNSK